MDKPPSDGHVRPRVLVSRCITFDSCRYNGLMIASPLVSVLKEHADCITPCPEADIGLGVPRSPVRLVGAGGKYQLMQPDTGRNVTEDMDRYASDFLATLGTVDGAILKARSPSCGLRDAKYYASTEKGPAVGRTQGLFASHVAASPTIPICEDELRLQNVRIREHFLTCIYAMARLRTSGDAASMSALYQFHAEHKLLLMAYNQTRMREMGRILASSDDPAKAYAHYRIQLSLALGSIPGAGSHINALMHALGYFSQGLSPEEKALFLDMLGSYRDNHIPLRALTSIIRTWALRFNETYLLGQRYFAPYPDVLSPLAEPERQRDFHV